MVADELEALALREDRRLVLEGSVAEVEHEAVRHAPGARELERVAVGDDRAVGRPENEKAADDPFRVAHGHGLRGERARAEAGDEDECGGF